MTEKGLQQEITIDIVFDGPPGPEAGSFVEAEDEQGRGIKVGEWIGPDERGWWRLRLAILSRPGQTEE